MREIKFRAWDGKKMLYGVTPWRPDFVLSRGTWKCLEIYCDITHAAYMKVPAYKFKVLEQFTGQQSPKGKDIYEGDIVKDKQERLEVIYSYGACKFCVKRWCGGDGFYGGYKIRSLKTTMEVIGNIHEDAHLLKREDE